MAQIDPLEAAIAQGAARALNKRAAKLREEAAAGIATTQDRTGRLVLLASPEARVKAGLAADFDEIADLISPTT